MIPKGLGQYDAEYADCSCFWGLGRGKYVELLVGWLQSGSVLDLGAGEGKNAIYLATKGFDVVAIECSAYAVQNFQNRLKTLPCEVQSRIEIVQEDVRQYEPVGQLDAVIAYGLIHCLPSVRDVQAVLRKMKAATRPGGFNVIVTFTDRLPVPAVQSYLEPTLVSDNFLPVIYSDWEVVAVEHGVIEETHPTSRLAHQHSVVRLLARRPDIV